MDDIKVLIPHKPTKFLDQLREHIRANGKAYATEITYISWVKQYIIYQAAGGWSLVPPVVKSKIIAGNKKVFPQI